MCKLKKYQKSNPRIDKCMKLIMEWFDWNLDKDLVQVKACCCGHGKYPMSIVVKDRGVIVELFTNKVIHRTRNFYKRDKQGYYYIPEVSKCQ